ncbi:hypothetical protein E2C01_046524 [Portunus trituberculatus]|uniref:Uncharacterized protein n=1 Tax=Portunus trituberculatus TaxID=210409 RepID=A0A5B7G6E1_PORTR|nr:hypothetical protein [Portunus trituberculatus]
MSEAPRIYKGEPAMSNSPSPSVTQPPAGARLRVQGGRGHELGLGGVEVGGEATRTRGKMSQQQEEEEDWGEDDQRESVATNECTGEGEYSKTLQGRGGSRLPLREEEEKATGVEVTGGAWDGKLLWPREKSFPKTREVPPSSKKLELPEEEDEG